MPLSNGGRRPMASKYSDLPVPDGLRKRGLTGYRSNLQEGQAVAINPHHFLMLFKDTLDEFARSKQRANRSDRSAD